MNIGPDTRKKAFRLLKKLLLVAIGVSLFLAMVPVVHSKPVSTDSYKGFIWHCNHPDKTPENIFSTIIKIKAGTGISGCEDAFASLKKKTFFVMRFAGISSLVPFKEFTWITDLSLGGNEIDDISPLKNLANLRKLNLGGYLGGNHIKNLNPLKKLTSLEELTLNRNQIRDLSPLQNLSNLKVLDLSRNNITNLQPLAKLTSLTELNLWSNRIRDLSPVSGLQKLTELNLNNNLISDISPLKDLKSLEKLWLRHNHIRNFKPVEHLQGIKLFLRD